MSDFEVVPELNPADINYVLRKISVEREATRFGLQVIVKGAIDLMPDPDRAKKFIPDIDAKDPVLLAEITEALYPTPKDADPKLKGPPPVGRAQRIEHFRARAKAAGLTPLKVDQEAQARQLLQGTIDDRLKPVIIHAIEGGAVVSELSDGTHDLTFSTIGCNSKRGRVKFIALLSPKE